MQKTTQRTKRTNTGKIKKQITKRKTHCRMWAYKHDNIACFL